MGGWGQPKDLTKKTIRVDQEDYVAPTTKKEGGETTAAVSDEAVLERLDDMLIVLKKIELHLSILTDMMIKDGDIE